MACRSDRRGAPGERAERHGAEDGTATVSSTSRKYENTTILRPLAAASSTISTSRRSLAEPTAAAGRVGGPAHGHEVALRRRHPGRRADRGWPSSTHSCGLDARQAAPEHVVLVAAQVDGRDGGPEVTGAASTPSTVSDARRPGRAGGGRPGPGTPRPGSPSGCRSGTGPGRSGRGPFADRLGALGAPGSSRSAPRRRPASPRRPGFRGLAQRPQGVERGDGDAACARPHLAVPLARRAGRAAGAASRSLCRSISCVQLTSTLAGQTTRKCVAPSTPRWHIAARASHRLAEAHLVAEHRPPLAERELRAERLVAAQGDAHQREVERVVVDPPRDVGRDEALPGFDVGCELADLDEQPVIEDGTFLVVPPQGGSVRCSAQPGRRGSAAAGCPGPTGALTSSGPQAG